jgi:hypothetical protein
VFADLSGAFALAILNGRGGEAVLALDRMATRPLCYTVSGDKLRSGRRSTANLWDYAAIIAKLIPNWFHSWIVSNTEGREEHDVFPVAYRTNTRGAVTKWAGGQPGFEVVPFYYLGQYPSYFMFNGFLFLLATGYEKLISRVPALNFLRGWILVTLRKPTTSCV